MSPAIKGLFFAIASMGISFGIYFYFLQKQDVYLADNPTNTIYYIKVNEDQEKIIGPGESLAVTLNKGSNKIQTYDAKKSLILDTAITVKKDRGLLNIAKKDYFIYTQYYGYNLNKDSLLATQSTIDIDGKKYYGGAERFNQLYTEDFYFNVNEPLDKVIKNIQKVETRKKIFRKEDFLQFYHDNYKL